VEPSICHAGEYPDRVAGEEGVWDELASSIAKAAILFGGLLWVRGIVVRWYQGRRLWIADMQDCEKEGVVAAA